MTKPINPPASNQRPALFITGGSRGLGRRLVGHFAASHQVGFGWHRSPNEARSLLAEMTERGCEASSYEVDVTNGESLNDVARQFAAAQGPCRVLIHTTGAFNELPLADTDEATWRQQLDTTVTGGFLAWRAFAPQLLAQPGARVIFIGDSAAEQLRARRQATAYYVGKHGLVLLARTLAAEHREAGLTCHVVSPGVLPNSIDLDRPGMQINVGFEEIAGIIDFLLSPAADAVSGSHLIASRGWNL